MSRLFTSLLAIASSVATVSAAENFGTLKDLITNFTTNVIATLGYLALTAAVVAFFFGVIQFIWAAREGEGAKMDKGKSFMLWGLVALFVMFSVWGIITFAQRALGPDFQKTDILIPKIKFDTVGGTPQTGSGPLPTSPTPGTQPTTPPTTPSVNGSRCDVDDVGDNRGIRYNGSCYASCFSSSEGATCVLPSATGLGRCTGTTCSNRAGM